MTTTLLNVTNDKKAGKMVLLQKYFCNLKRQELTTVINLYIGIIKKLL